MKLALGLVIAFFGLGYGLAQILRARRQQADSVSAAWLTEREVRDAITQGQYEGVVKFPWRGKSDEAA